MPAALPFTPLHEGITVRLGDDSPASELEQAIDSGYHSVRLPLDWAQFEPVAGCLDEQRLAALAAAVDRCEQRGIGVLISLNAGDMPSWAGAEFWLDLQSPERFARWADEVARRIDAPDVAWTTLDGPNAYALQTWVIGAGGARRALDIAATVRTLDHMTAAHVLAYEAIHAHAGNPMVGTNTYAMSVYEFGRLAHDVLTARHHGTARADLREWLTARRRSWYSSAGNLNVVERAVRRLARSSIQLEMAMPRTAGAVYRSPHPRCVDVVQVDFHQPAASAYLRAPARNARQVRRWKPVRGRGETPGDVSALGAYLRLVDEPALDTWLVQTSKTDAAELRREVDLARAAGRRLARLYHHDGGNRSRAPEP